MDQIIITHRNGTTLKLNSKENISAIKKATQQVELLGLDVIDISVESAKKMNFYIGDKITVIGRDYTLNTPAKERKISESQFVYDMQFEGVQYDLLRATFNVNIDTTSNQIQDINGDGITGNIKMFLDVLIANANRVFGTGKWVLGTYPSNTKTLTLTFSDSDNCLSVLQNLCGEENFNTEFKIAIDGSGNRTINLGATGNNFTYTFQYGKGKGIYELTREKVSSSNIITRLNCFGSSKNIITPKYRASKLCLPTKTKSQSFLENTTAISTYGIWEGSKDFDDVYPHRTGTITSLGANVFEFIDSSMNFDLNEKNVDGSTKYLMEGASAKIKFNTGNLAGYEFEVNKYENSTKKFTITSQQDQNDYLFPSTTTSAFQFEIGDEYVITDIYMPQSYIDTAEAELATKGAAYLAKYSQPLVQYGLTLDSNFLKNQVGANASSNIVWVGDYIPIKDTDLEVDKTIRVKGFTRDLMLDYSYQLTIADLSISVSTITRVITGMDTIDKVIKINNLNDPARARRNWKDSQEVLNMVFDTEGDFYTDKIKPLSIETSMLSVSAKSMQFGLEGTIFQPNYLGAKNRVVYVGGVLSHYAILDSNNDPASWNITSGDFTMNSDTARYVYAKCSRSSTAASILFSETQITVDSDGAYYHFLIGILNSVDVNNTRALALMYGFTTVNGRFIKTGRIQSADGNTYFDLDAGEFKGVIKFTSGETVQQAIATAANNIQVGGRNLLIGSSNGIGWTSASGINPYISDSSFSVTAVSTEESQYIWSQYFTLKGNQIITLSFESKEDAIINTRDLYILPDNYGSIGLLTTEFSKNADWTKLTFVFTTPSSWGTGASVRLRFDHNGSTTGGAATIYARKIKLEIGNKASDWTAAPEDVDAVIATKAKHFTGTSNPVPPYTQGIDIWTNGTDLYKCAVTRASGSYVAGDFVKATGYDNTQTVIDGGIVTAGTLEVAGDSNILAGITGQNTGSTAVRMWAGASFASRNIAPFRVQQDGKVYMSNAEIAGKVTANSGSIGDWRISAGGIINDTTDSYIIGRQSGISGYSESRIGSSVLPPSSGLVIPAYITNTIENQFADNIALFIEAKHGYENKAIQATGDVVMTVGDAISSKLNYINLYVGSVNVIYIRNGLKIHSRNVSGATRALYLPTVTDIRDYLFISAFSVTSAAAVSSTTATVYYVAKGNGLFVGDAIKYSTSAYQTIVDIIRYESSSYDKITVETTLGIAVANGGTFTAIHEFSVEINISQDSIAVQNQIDVYPNGATFYDNNGGTFTSVAMGRGDIMKVLCFTRKNVMYYQLVHYKNA